MKTFLLILFSTIVLAASMLFFAQNDSMVEIKYFVGSLHWQMNWVLAGALAAGIILGVIAMLGSLVSAKLKLVNANRRIKTLGKKLNQQQTLPIKNDF